MNRTCRSMLCTVLALAAAGTGSAFAQPTAAAQADAALAEGRRLYDLQEWDQAIAKFKEAYRLRADAPALFNIAQSFRLKGDCAQAVTFYRTYKRNFSAEKNIGKVEKFIAEMEACIAKGGTAPAPPSTGTPTTTTTNPTTTPTTTTTPAISTTPPRTEPTTPSTTSTSSNQDIPGVVITGSTTSEPAPYTDSGARPGRGMRIAGIVTGGVGAALLVGGVVFGLRARSAEADAEALGPGDTWNPALQARGEQASARAKWMLIGGGVAAAGGAVLFVLGSNKASEAEHVTLVPTGDGAAVSWSGRF